MNLRQIILFCIVFILVVMSVKTYLNSKYRKRKLMKKRQEQRRRELQKKRIAYTPSVKNEKAYSFENLSSENYRKQIYDQTSTDFKPHLMGIFQTIDELSYKEEVYKNEIEKEIYSSFEDIIRKADYVEWRIKNYWNDAKYKKDFIFYIGLYYASHLLGIALREEQQKIKNIFVEYKNKQEKWDSVIAQAQAHRETLHGEERRKRSEDIERMYKIHKNISVVKNKIGEINTKFRERVTAQFIETGKRRDYIGIHCGERGARWRAKILANHPSSQ